MNKNPDYIILGAGAAGLMLAYRMATDAFFKNTQITIIDKQTQKGNDRTWCFWENGSGEWDHLLYKTWDKVYFGSPKLSKTINILPYVYKMIKSDTFYKHLWQTINTAENITFIHAQVNSLTTQISSATAHTSVGDFTATSIFNSIVFNTNYTKQNTYPVLQQHFVGWFIKTQTPQFDDSVATFMDFNIPQQGNTRFMYVLPTSTTQALFEYTLFSEHLLDKSIYENAIRAYLQQKGITNYSITETEMGAIPMTCYEFQKQNSAHILHIGTAGGWTKASTGYTFKNTTKQTKALLSFLKTNSNLNQFARRGKHWYYDVLMLDVLANDNAFGAELFSSLFKNTNVHTILKFLDEESTLLQDLKIITAVPSLRFSKLLVKRLLNKNT